MSGVEWVGKIRLPAKTIVQNRCLPLTFCLYHYHCIQIDPEIVKSRRARHQKWGWVYAQANISYRLDGHCSIKGHHDFMSMASHSARHISYLSSATQVPNHSPTIRQSIGEWK